MKRLKFFFTAFLLFVAVGISAQEFPTVSTDGNVCWYAIRFVSSAKCITAYSAGEVTTADFTGDDAQLWKITGNGGDAGFAFTNKKGLVLSVESAERDRLVNAEETERYVSRFAITNENGHLEIRPKGNNSLAMNFWGGTGEKIGLWDASPADDNNYVEFVEVFSSDDYVFTLTDGVYALAGYTGNGTEIVLPAGFNGNSYVIGSRAFFGNTAITSVVIPEGVTGIGDYAFQNCNSLNEVSIGEGVLSIGFAAFNNAAIERIKIPASVTSVGNAVFAGCQDLVQIVVAEDNSSYHSGDGCNAIIETASNTLVAGCNNTSIPAGVEIIAPYAFYNCRSLTSIEIPNSVTSIGYAAFAYCSGLTSIEIPNSVTSIEESAFNGCSGLTSIEIPDGVTSIGSYAFQDCSGLTSIEIPNSVTSIGYAAFAYCSRLTSIEIPNSVTSIGNYAFYGCTELKTVINHSGLIFERESTEYGHIAFYAETVDNTSVNVVGNYVFTVLGGVNVLAAYTGSEAEIVLPDNYNGATYVIGDEVFKGNETITSVVIPDGVTSVGFEAFCRCSSLSALEIQGTPTLQQGAFSRTGLEEVFLPEGITEIPRWCFDNSPNLRSVTIPSSVTAILDYAFQGCPGLTSIEIPNSVTSIGWGAFYGCSGLTSIVIPNSVTSIGRSAFYDCYNLTSIEIPNSVTSIGDYAFQYCNGLTSIEIPNSVTSIGSYAFYNCSRLTSIEIPNSVTSIGDYAFAECYNLKTVYNNSALDIVRGSENHGFVGYYAERVINNVVTEGDYLFTVTDGVNVLLGYTGSETDIVLPADYNSATYVIGDKVFKENGTITSVVIPSSVTSIGDYAFQGCTGLTSIEIPGSVTSIGYAAFQSCYSLNEVSIGEGVSSIGFAAFNNTAIERIKIPASVTSVGNAVFVGCTALAQIVVAENNSSYHSGNGCNAIIETASNTLVAGCNNTSIPAGVEIIAPYAFYYCSGLTSIEIPNSVTSIGDEAFYYCSGLTSIEIPNSVTSIRSAAFQGCSGLTEIVVAKDNTVYDSREGCNAIIETASKTLIVGCQNTVIPSSVTSIGNSAFYDCYNLTSIEIPSSVTSIGYEAFYNCYGLTSITIPNSVTSIGDRAFLNCYNLTSIEIPGSVTSIGYEAFYNCSNLTSIEIPGSVTSIGDYAFRNCSGLTSIEIPNSVTSIGYAAFYDCNNLKTVYNYSNLMFTKGSGDFGYIAYYADKVINAPGGAVVDDYFIFAEIDGVNTLVGYLYPGDYQFETANIEDWTSAIAGQDNSVDSKTYEVEAAPGTILSFDWSVSSEERYDWLRVYVDGVAVLGESGEASGHFEYEFDAAGVHTVEFSYSKDGGVDSGSDKGRIYNISPLAIRVEAEYPLELPDSYNGYSYVIGEGAFRGHDGMTSVTIPATVTNICDMAFYGCKKLGTVYNNSGLNIVAGSEDHGYVAYYAQEVIAGDNNVPVTGIELDKTAVTLVEGEAVTLTATVSPADATNKNVTWTSSVPSVATVENGVVTAVAEGTAVITATAGNCSAVCEVTVEKRVVPVTGVTLDRRTVTLVEGESVTLVATVYPDNATDKGVVWTSANENVAIVENGVVTAVAEGTAVITATAGNYRAVCEVTVEKPYVAVAGIELDNVEATLLPGESVELVATVYPDDATNKNVSWTSSDRSVAIVVNGVVTAIAPGTARITAKAGNFSAFCEITVDVPYGVSLDKASLALYVGSSATLVATVNVAEGDDATVTWTSSNTNAVQVNENGEVKAVAPGTATITATAAGTTATCTVTVSKRPVAVSGIELDKPRVTLKQGAKIALTATVEPADATNKSVTWTTSDEAVAKVNEEGVVTAVAEGTATITATAGEYSAKCRVTVTGPVLVTEVVLDIDEKTITEGKSFRLVATVGPDDADDKTVVWSTSDESVATVKGGVVTAVAPGYAVITATSGECSAECLVIVEAKYVAVRGIKLDKSRATVTEGDTLVLVATVTPENATDKNVEWTSSDEAVAVVEDGVVTAVAPGSVVITAKIDKYTAKCTITVKKGVVAVTGITLSETEVTLVEYETMTLVATVAPDDADDKSVVWSTSDEAVVTVENGVITAVAPGVAVITAEASGFTAECTVTVEALSSIDQVKLDAGTLVIYDLNGQRIVRKEDLVNGVYIINGNKVVVK